MSVHFIQHRVGLKCMNNKVKTLSLQVSLLNTRWRQATMICLDVDSKRSEILLSIYCNYFEVVSMLGLKCILFLCKFTSSGKGWFKKTQSRLICFILGYCKDNITFQQLTKLRMT